MLEDPTFLVSRDVPNTCEEENQWIYNTFRAMESSNNKRRLEVEEDQQVVSRKSHKLSDDPKEEEAQKNLIFHFPILDQIIEQNDAVFQSDTNSLIEHLGRDMTISCLLRCSRSDYGSIESLNRSFRSLIRSGEIYKLRRQMGIVEYWVYFSHSALGWNAFDPNRRRWMKLPRMPSDDCFICSDKESLAVGTELLVFGRELMSQTVFRYSLLTNEWSYGTEMNTSRCLFGSASLGEIAILAGGSDAYGKILDVAELYNSNTRTWETLPRMNKARRMCSGVFMDGKFYVIGGVGTGEQKQLLTCGEEFDLETREWREIPNMLPRSEEAEADRIRSGRNEAPPLVAVVNNVLYAADYASREVKRYVKDSNSWDSIGRLPERADAMSGWGIGFRSCGDKLIVVGGDQHASPMIEVNAWAPDDGGELQWSLLGTNKTGNFVFNCAVMGC